MNDQSKTSYPANFEATSNAISSPASESGPMPCAKPDGPMTEKSGLEVAPANLSARQAKEKGLLTSGTYGPRFITSSGSVRLETSLVNRLRQKTALLGSRLFQLTWKQRDTPLGVSISALRASALRTSGKDCIGWQTPTSETQRKSQRAIMRSENNGRRSGGGQSSPPGLEQEAEMAAGLIPAELQGDQMELTRRRLGIWPINAAAWSTPRANKWGFPDAHGSHERPVNVAGWPTTTRDFRSESASDEFNKKRWDHPRGKPLNAVVLLTDFGPTPNGSPALTENRGQLNPGLPRWLQGLPIAWESCADMVTRSVRRSRKVSSKPI